MFEEPGKLRWPSPQSVNVGRDSNRVGPPFAKDVENAHCDNVIQSEVCCKQNPCTNTGIQNNESLYQFSNDHTIEGCEQNIENESCRPKGESIRRVYHIVAYLQVGVYHIVAYHDRNFIRKWTSGICSVRKLYRI